MGSLFAWVNSVTAGDGYLSITPDPQQGNYSTSPSLPLIINKVGRVLYAHPVLAWPATISTTFTVRISAFQKSTNSGDGMAFVFAQDHSPSPPGSYGSYLGLLDISTEGKLSTLCRNKKNLLLVLCSIIGYYIYIYIERESWLFAENTNRIYYIRKKNVTTKKKAIIKFALYFKRSRQN
jgi:hypothetical protein